MKYATLLAVLFLSACAAKQGSPTVMPALDSDDQMKCARNCEYVHGGTVRACNAGRSSATRAAWVVSDCIDDAYIELRSCYWTCN